MVMAPMHTQVRRESATGHLGAPHPPPAPSVVPAGPRPGRPVRRTLRAESMVAVPLEPGEAVDTRWVERMRGPYTSRARHLLQRALARPASGPPPADRHPGDPVPIWAREAAACHRGVLDALGMDVPPALDVPARPDGPLLIQHLVPAISLGWYLVTTVHATDREVLLLEGTYAEHESDEAPFPVRWS
jgi:hypothetical protein